MSFSPEQLHTLLEDFHPQELGDPVRPLANAFFFPPESAWLWGLSALAIALPLAWLWIRPMSQSRHRTAVLAWLKLLPFSGLPALFSVLLALSANLYWGGPFAYDNYRIPVHPGDAVIWFTGADDGAFTANYWEGTVHRSAYQFGYGRAALFSFADVDKALLYAEQLPAKSRLLVRGHSMGAAAAVAFAEHSPREILLLDTRDPTSWFHRDHKLPPMVRIWRNALPETRNLFPPRKDHYSSNYWGPLNMANLFRLLGGAWDSQPGATNLIVPGRDHHSIGNNLPEDPCLEPMVPLPMPKP